MHCGDEVYERLTTVVLSVLVVGEGAAEEGISDGLGIYSVGVHSVCTNIGISELKAYIAKTGARKSPDCVVEL